MPSHQEDYVTTYYNTVQTNSLTLNSMNFPYTYSSTALTAASVIDLNGRSFTFNSLTQKVLQQGKFNYIQLDFDLTGTAGAGNPNKYEFTLSGVTAPIVHGHYVGYDVSNADVLEIRSCIIYGGNKVRIVNSNSMNVTQQTNDYSTTGNRQFIGKIYFSYAT